MSRGAMLKVRHSWPRGFNFRKTPRPHVELKLPSEFRMVK
jgi:hypothetical protein